MTNTKLYFKGIWPDEDVPDGEPYLMYFEVIEAKDVVTRTVELFVGGRKIRNSIELAEREGPDQRPPEHRSLIYDAFLEPCRDFLTQVTEEEFCNLWDSATDKSWPQTNEYPKSLTQN